MNSEDSMTIKCSECGYVFQNDELEPNPRELKPCPDCGALRRHAYLTHKETLSLNGYVHLEAKKQGSKHKGNRADYEFGEGKKKGKDGEMVYKKRVVNREQTDLPGSYIEVVKDKDGNVVVNKNEKLSEHRASKRGRGR